MTQHVTGVLALEKRAEPRFDVSLQVFFVWQGSVIQATAKDVSLGGMRLITEVDLVAGTIVEGHFAPPGSITTHRIQAEVKWSGASSEVAGLYECGVQFDKLDGPTREQLRIIIQKLAQGAEKAQGVEEAAPAVLPTLPEVDADDLPMADDSDVIEVTPEPVDQGAFDPARLNEELQAAMRADTAKRDVDAVRARMLLAQGRQSRAQNRLDEAEGILNEATRLLPESEEILEELAGVIYAKGDVIAAAELFDRALRIRQEKK